MSNDKRWTLINEDCREAMSKMEAESVDSIVTDPPYGLGFMGKGWDHGVPGVPFWIEALRVAKPGAYLLAFGGTRTFHRLAVAIEDAGWEIRDTIMWVYGSGFPKSLDVSKAIDKAARAERSIVGQGRYATRDGSGRKPDYNFNVIANDTIEGRGITAPATDAARQWSGWGTALKPAWEPVIVARKPLIGTVAENVLRYGAGAINIDESRIGSGGQLKWEQPRGMGFSGGTNYGNPTPGESALGRWPANVIHDGSDEVVGPFPNARSSCGGGKSQKADIGYAGGWKAAYDNSDGQYYDSGSAARFFYCAKASKADRDEGLDDFPTLSGGEMTDCKDDSAGTKNPRAGEGRNGNRKNNHPTVKPTDLMRYLCRLVTQPNGIVLDPFMGSGSTGKAAVLEGFRFVGIDLQEEYVKIAEARIKDAYEKIK